MKTEKPVYQPQLDLGFVRRGDRTIIDRRLFSWPFVITRTFWLDQCPADMLTVILQTGSGAMHGEDFLAQRIWLGEGASVHLTTQGATSVHRADPGCSAREAIDISVAAGGFLEYLPEPRILFPDAALSQSIDINCAANATAIVSDAFTVYDPENRGRSFQRMEATTRLRIDGGQPVMVDRLDITNLSSGRRQAQYTSYGSMILVAAKPVETLERLSLQISARMESIPNLYAAASVLPGQAGVGVKLAGGDLRSLRAGLEVAWTAFRIHCCGATPPSRRKADAA
ncbi:urease accessory protein UreD [Rhizobium sp. rho-13.1]|nr:MULTISPECIES: urease accessory protein UreD [unclassified Rhizobium]MBO9101699.1 urease accessory protein UreD [Rhizobium sp. L58/93]MBO9187755.1 urease accessory protein UreD [Rhizobium sp. E27B/91]TQX85233.1 urease accessory protein UreD [Rhizobium sp. rho-13.1]TQY09521.1 urease accessory protein UreD [Rhizobium sp. rho-1.1]QXZ86356.1 urease accessory protein UreD [Rhizobium sp. K1/93]